MLVTNNKGGVGKTTAALSLFAAASYESYSVCIADMDRQANATRWCVGSRRSREVQPGGGFELTSIHEEGQQAQLFTLNSSARDVGEHVLEVARTAGGYVLPANPNMNPTAWANVRLDLIPHDVVIVDTPPGLPWGLVVRLIAQSDFVVCPTHAESFSVEVLPDIVDAVVEAGRSDMLERGTFKVLLNAVQRNAGHKAWEAVLRKHHAGLLFQSTWPRAASFPAMTEEHAKHTQKTKPVALARELWAEIMGIYNDGRAAA